MNHIAQFARSTVLAKLGDRTNHSTEAAHQLAPYINICWVQLGDRRRSPV